MLSEAGFASPSSFYLSDEFLTNLLLGDGRKSKKANSNRAKKVRDQQSNEKTDRRHHRHTFPRESRKDSIKTILATNLLDGARSITQEQLYRSRCEIDYSNSNVASNCSETNWLTELNLVTLLPPRPIDFSICDRVLEPLDLIHVAYLLSAIARPVPQPQTQPKSDGVSESNRLSVSKDLLVKLQQYTQECSRNIKTSPVCDEVALVDNSHVEVYYAKARLEAIISHILLRHPDIAVNAIVTLNEVQSSSSSYAEELIIGGVDLNSSRSSFLDLCVGVIYPLSWCDTCCRDTNSNSTGTGTSKSGVGNSSSSSSSSGSNHSSSGGNNSSSDDKHLVYRTAVQDALLKTMLVANEFEAVALFLLRWRRYEDLKVYSKSVWESVQYMVGEHEKDEEYSPQHSSVDATWRTVQARRPLPNFENIADTGYLEDEDGLNDVALEADQRLDRHGQKEEDMRSSPLNKSVHINSSESQNRSKEGPFEHCNAELTLAPNVSNLLRKRLVEASVIQKIVDRI